MALKMVGSNVTSKMTSEEKKKHEDIVKSGKTKYVAPKTSSKKSSKKSTGIGGVEAGTTSEERRLARKAAEEEGTIYLGGAEEKADTSIKGQIEKAKDLPFPINVLASPKTTAVLGITLATVTGLSLLGVGGGAAAAPLITTEQGTLMVNAASRIATNTKTITTTTNLLTKLGVAAPLGVMAIIGTYPFAGFIKEEALQTLSMGTYSAMKKGNIEEAEKALAMQDEILNPSIWERIINTIPFTNVMKQLYDFYKAAKLKTEIDRELITQMKTQQETGETDNDMWDRIYKEQDERKEAQRKADEEYYKEIAKNAKEAAKERRAEDTKYWNKIWAEKEKKTKADREANDKYWEEVRKEWAKLKEDTRPSNLNFGLL